jgi:hypothetical protein
MALTPGIPKGGGLPSWQRANIVAAISYLGDVVRRSPDDVRAKAVYEGLMEILEPGRRLRRTQRELTTATRAASPTGKERRSGRDRRNGDDRRAIDLGSPIGTERRTGRDRRRPADRRRR